MGRSWTCTSTSTNDKHVESFVKKLFDPFHRANLVPDLPDLLRQFADVLENRKGDSSGLDALPSRKVWIRIRAGERCGTHVRRARRQCRPRSRHPPR
jgi:hypothetical protein